MGLGEMLNQLLSLTGLWRVEGTPTAPSPATITFYVSDSERREATGR